MLFGPATTLLPPLKIRRDISPKRSVAAKEFTAFSGRVKAGRPDLVSPPRLRYISPSVGGV
jgi:hypothetical protein